MKKLITITILLIASIWVVFIYVNQNSSLPRNNIIKSDTIPKITYSEQSIKQNVDVIKDTGLEEDVSENIDIINNNVIEEVDVNNEVEIVEEGVKVLPKSVLLKVDFTSQAPFRDWNQPWQDTCEETAVLMTMRYFDGRGIISKEDTRDALLQLIEWEDENFGFYKDTSASTTMAIIQGFYGYNNVKLNNNVTVENIKKELADGSLIILPAAGKILKNPYFTPPGPVYHQIVLVGYDDNNKIFYANDPGIMSGGNFKYSYDNIMAAVADWDYMTTNIDMNKRVMIVVGKP